MVADVIEKWAEEIELRTKLPAIKRNSVSKIIEEEPSESAKHELYLLFTDQNVCEYFFKKIGKSEKCLQWIVALKDQNYFSGEWIRSNAKEDNIIASMSLDLVYKELINNPDNEVLKEMSKSIVKSMMSAKIEDNLSRVERYVHRTCEEIIVLIFEEINDDSIDYLKRMSDTIDNDLSNIISPLVENRDVFSKRSANSKLSLSELILGLMHNPLNLVNEYWFGEFYESILTLLPQYVQEKLFQPMLHVINQRIGDSPYFCPELGAVDEYIIEHITDRATTQIIQWFCLIIKSITKTLLSTFVKGNLKSKYHLLNTLALHAINIRYDDLKDHFWSLNNYDGINYSELYTLIKNNICNFTEEDISAYIDAIEKTSFAKSDEKIELIKKYRYDLIYLLPEKNTDRLRLLSKYSVADTRGFQKVSDRGKLFVITSKQGDDIHSTFDIKDFSNLLSLVEKNGTTQELLFDAEIFFRKNNQAVMDNLDSCQHLPIDYHYPLFDIFRNKVELKDKIFNFFKCSSYKIVEEDHVLLSGMINSFSEWVIKSGMNNSETFEFLLSLAESVVDIYNTEKQRKFDDLLTTSLNNWYASILWVLLERYDTSITMSFRHKLILLFEKSMVSEFVSCRILIKGLLAYKWNLVEDLDSDWAKNHYKEVLFDADNKEIIATYMYSGSFNVSIYSDLLDNNRLKDLIFSYKEIEAFNNHDLPEIIASMAMYFFFNEESLNFEPLIAEAISSDYCSESFIRGLLSQLRNEDLGKHAEETKIAHCLNLIINNINSNSNLSHVQHKLIEYIESSNEHMELKLSLAITVSNTKISHITDEFMSCLMKLVPTYKNDVCTVMKNLSNKSIYYYPEGFSTLVLKLIENNSNFDDLRIICNNMGKKGFYDYDSMMEKYL